MTTTHTSCENLLWIFFEMKAFWAFLQHPTFSGHHDRLGEKGFEPDNPRAGRRAQHDRQHAAGEHLQQVGEFICEPIGQTGFEAIS